MSLWKRELAYRIDAHETACPECYNRKPLNPKPRTPTPCSLARRVNSFSPFSSSSFSSPLSLLLSCLSPSYHPAPPSSSPLVCILHLSGRLVSIHKKLLPWLFTQPTDIPPNFALSPFPFLSILLLQYKIQIFTSFGQSQYQRFIRFMCAGILNLVEWKK